MFGAFRLALALVVAAAHLGNLTGFAAGYAVYAFYALSGYLMCVIINERYADRFALFCLNRALRIYPLYWLGCLFSLGLVATIPADTIAAFHANIRAPETAYEVLSNLLIVGLVPAEAARLVPPAWAVAVELVFYLAIGAYLGRGRRRALIWLLLSAGYHVLALRFGWDRYYSAQSASLAFSIGACLYQFRDELRRVLPLTRLGLALSLAVYGLWLGAVPWMSEPTRGPFYVSLALCALALHHLAQWKSVPLRKADEWLGNLSYPVYLFHYHVGLLVSLHGIPAKTPELFMVALLPLLVVSTAAAVIYEATIERVRRALARQPRHVHALRSYAPQSSK